MSILLIICACSIIVVWFVLFFRSDWVFGSSEKPVTYKHHGGYILFNEKKPSPVKTVSRTKKFKYLGAYIGGVLLIVNAMYIHLQTKEQNQSNYLVRKGQLDTRFKDAALLLANGNSSAEFSAIHALHQIAIEASQSKDQKDYVKVIKDILTGFIKDNSVIKKDTSFNKKSNLLLQSIIDYLFIDTLHRDIYSKFKTDLSYSVLNYFVFEGAELQGANFFGAQLQSAIFLGAQLQCADFFEAQLQNAFFWEGRLQYAYFLDAQLQGADFMSAHLEGADFSKAQLQGADFNCAFNIDSARFFYTSWNSKTNFKGTAFENKSIEELTKIMGKPPDVDEGEVDVSL